MTRVYKYKIRTSKTRRFLECNTNLCRVPATVVTVEKERWLAHRVYGHGWPSIACIWRVGGHDAQRVLAVGAHEAVASTSFFRWSSSQKHALDMRQHSPVLLCADTCTGNLEETIWTVVPANFDHDAAVAPYRVAFFAKVEVVQRVEAI